MKTNDAEVLTESVREDVERAIREKLHVRVEPMWHEHQALRTPEAIDGDHIVMQDSDCGSVKPRMRWTVSQWVERTGFGQEHRNLWRQTGFWDFTPYDDEDWEVIKFANRHPNSAGRELAQLRREVEKMRREVAGLREIEKHHALVMGDHDYE